MYSLTSLFFKRIKIYDTNKKYFKIIADFLLHVSGVDEEEFIKRKSEVFFVCILIFNVKILVEPPKKKTFHLKLLNKKIYCSKCCLILFLINSLSKQLLISFLERLKNFSSLHSYKCIFSFLSSNKNVKVDN